jgi:immune inhibitor A
MAVPQPLVDVARRSIAYLTSGRNDTRRAFAGVGGIVVLLGLLGCGIAPAPPWTPSPTFVPAPTPTPSPAATPFALPIPPPLRRVDLRQRINPPTLPPPTTPILPRDDPVGTEHEFQVWPPPPAPFGAHVPLHAHLAAKTSHAWWYVQDGLDVPAAALETSANVFEGRTYPTVQRTFGWDAPPGIDHDRRITILIGDISIAGSGVVFGSHDLLPAWASTSTWSNQRKIIYANVDVARRGSPQLDSAVALPLAQIAWETGHPDQDFWVKSGTFLVAAEEASGQLSMVVDQQGPGDFTFDPTLQLNGWRSDQWNTPAADEAAAYLFARYVADRFGGSTAFAPVFAAPGRGVAAYDQLFRSYQQPTTFDAVFGDWVAANVLDDPALDDGHYGYQRNLKFIPNVEPGPTMSSSVGGQATQLGTTYHRVTPTRTSTLDFTGDRTIPLLGANPRESGYEWWSNRGDNVDSRLTRPVDLRSVKTATLRFWTWFEIEKDFDYAYVEVSTDGGTTWRTLATPDTTRDNSNGLNLDDGFTGTSGGTPPRWVQETADLTPYAGREILLRFEYVTDAAVQGDGFVLDGVEIPEINFHDTTSSDNGWVAEGFVRTDNVAPQPWLVEIISHDPAHPVRRLTVRPDGTGSIPLDAGQSVVVAIAGLAPNSTQKPIYQLRLLPR